VDLLAAVDAYPQPDEKIRTRSLSVTGGGNTANQLVAAARLGPWLRPRLWSKLGDDAYGKDIFAGLAAEAVDCAEVVVQAGSASPFTYILVDLANHTRTCIHTPGPVTRPEELLGSAVDRLLDGAALCCFDGRLADAALVLADAAQKKGIPILVEAEKPRDGLDALLERATSVCTSASFPTAWTAQAELTHALLAMWERLPRAQVIVTTLGSEGSVALQRCPAPPGGDISGAHIVDAAALATALRDLRAATAGGPPVPPAGSPPVPRTCVSSPVWRIGPTSWGRVLFTPAAVVHPSDVVDTTGAGDAFIGSLAFGQIEGLPLERALALASWVAAHKCRLPGPRPGLPRREQVPPQLLQADAGARHLQ
jgi:sugar/nucleoside kinase (ribokinase family)